MVLTGSLRVIRKDDGWFSCVRGISEVPIMKANPNLEQMSEVNQVVFLRFTVGLRLFFGLVYGDVSSVRLRVVFPCTLLKPLHHTLSRGSYPAPFLGYLLSYTKKVLTRELGP